MSDIGDNAARIAREGAAAATRFHLFGRHAKRAAAAEETLQALDALSVSGSHPFNAATDLIRRVAATAGDAPAAQTPRLAAGLRATADRTEALVSGGVCPLAALAVDLLNTCGKASAPIALDVVSQKAVGLSKCVADLADVPAETRLELLASPLDATKNPTVARAQDAYLAGRTDSPWKTWATSFTDASVAPAVRGAALSAIDGGRPFDLATLRELTAPHAQNPAFAPGALDALGRQIDAEALSLAGGVAAVRAEGRPPPLTLAAVLTLLQGPDKLPAAWLTLAQGATSVQRLQILTHGLQAVIDAGRSAQPATDLRELDVRLSRDPVFTPEIRAAILEKGLQGIDGTAPMPLVLDGNATPAQSNAYTKVAAALLTERSNDAETVSHARLAEQLAESLPIAFPSERRQAVQALEGALRTGGLSRAQRTGRILSAVLPTLSRADDRNAVGDLALASWKADATPQEQRLIDALVKMSHALDRWGRARVTESFARTLSDRSDFTPGTVVIAARGAVTSVWPESARRKYANAVLDAIDDCTDSSLTPGITQGARAELQAVAPGDDTVRAGASPVEAALRNALEKHLVALAAVYDKGVLHDTTLDAEQAHIEQTDDAVMIGHVRVPVRGAENAGESTT